MQCTLSPKATLIFDKILSINKSNYITIDTLSDLTVHLYSQNLSQYTIIRINPCFFNSFHSLGKITSFSFHKLYKIGLKSLEIDQTSANTTKLYYLFDKVEHHLFCDNIKINLFDFDFIMQWTFKLDLNCVKDIIKKIKCEFIILSFSNILMINYNNTIVSIPIQSTHHINEISELLGKFQIERKIFLKIIQNSYLFSEHVLAFSNNTLPLNIILRNTEIHVSTFISVEWLD